MSDIQRWGIDFTGDRPWIVPWNMGGYVTYADHVAAVAAAQREGSNQGYLNGVATNVDNSFKAGVKAAELQDYYGEQAQGHYMDGYKMGYAKGLIEGDSGGRKEGYRAGYDTAWSLSAVEIERATEARVREEEQAAQTLARAELYSMEEMDERCTQAADEAFAAGVKAARDAVAALPSALNCWDRYGFHIEKNDALATIDALQTSLSGPAVLLSSEPEPPTSADPAGEEHGAHVFDLVPSIAVYGQEKFSEGVQAARDAIPDNDHGTDLDPLDYDGEVAYGLAIAKAAIDGLEKP